MKILIAAILFIAIAALFFLGAIYCYDQGYVYGALIVAYVGGLVEFFVLAQFVLGSVVAEFEDDLEAI